MKKCLTLMMFVFIAHSLHAQKEGNIWCFGSYCELNFNSGSPVNVAGVAIDAWEGSSSIADTSGNLLFYTDGDSVWDKNNVAMPNGFGLLGANSSTEAALIVKQSGNQNIFYVFTTDAFQGANGFKYSVVDMNLNSGLGDVTAKNVNILPVCDERVAAIYHANGKDIWVITTTGNSDTIQSFLLSDTGFNQTPVVNATGVTHGISFQGYLKPSPSGNKLAVAYFAGGFDLYDFDRSTGMVSNPVVMKNNLYSTAYGVEFSPDETRMYGVDDEGYSIFQFNLTAGSAQAIINSELVVGNSSDVDLGSLQLAPDGKIYLARIFTPYLGVINNPNTLGVGCNFVDSGFYLTYGSSLIGLPNIFIYHPDSMVPPVALFTVSDTSICTGSAVFFTNLSGNANTYHWTFPGAVPDTSSLKNPENILYPQPGKYSVQLIADNGKITDTLLLKDYVIVQSRDSLTISSTPDTLCPGMVARLTSTGVSGNAVHWQSASSGGHFAYIIGVDSTYYNTPPLFETTNYRLISGAGFCADTSNAIAVVINSSLAPPVLTAPDSLICYYDSALIQAPDTFTSYLWNNNDTGSYTYADHAGGYWVTVTDANGCSAVSNRKYISVFPFPQVDIAEQGDTLFSSGAADYQWILNGSPIKNATGPVFVANEAGTYSVQVTDSNGCAATSNKVPVTTGLTLVDRISGIEIYPNPFSNTLFMNTSTFDVPPTAIEIIDMLGKLLERNEIIAKHGVTKVTLDALPEGMYCVKVISGEKNYMQLMVRQ